MNTNKLAQELQKAISETDSRKPKGYDTQATVRRVDGDTVWVHIPGGVDETPVRRTVNAQVGDNVQVRVSNGSAFLVGNATSPPTDDTVAIAAQVTASEGAEMAAHAENIANIATEYATDALSSAVQAQNYAKNAESSAASAQEQADLAGASANAALTQLSTVEDVVGVLGWISEHGEYRITTDTEVVSGKLYFTKTCDKYDVIVAPSGNPYNNGYYELASVNEAVSNYVASHLALTDEGLWVVKDKSSARILITNNGFQIHDVGSEPLASFSDSGISYRESVPLLIGKESDQHLHWKDSDGDGIADTLDIVGNVTLSSGESVEELVQGAIQKADDADKKITQLRVGARNLLRNTQFIRNGEHWEADITSASGDITQRTSIENELHDDDDDVYLQVTLGDNIISYAMYQDRYGVIKPDTYYTFSMDYMLTGIGDNTRLSSGIRYYLIGSEEPQYLLDDTEITANIPDWRHLVYTFKTKNNNLDNVDELYLYIQLQGSQGVLSIKRPKLEEGTIATTWSIAPEDALDIAEIYTTSVRSELKTEIDSISATVKSQKKISDSQLESIEGIVKEIQLTTSQQITSDQVQTIINETIQKSDKKEVTTETGFTFNKDGLTINKSDSSISTQITENGMTVSSTIGDDSKQMLVANTNGVDAENLHATTYLIIGTHSRFEDYSRGSSERTGCFWIGG